MIFTLRMTTFFVKFSDIFYEPKVITLKAYRGVKVISLNQNLYITL